MGAGPKDSRGSKTLVQGPEIFVSYSPEYMYYKADKNFLYEKDNNIYLTIIGELRL